MFTERYLASPIVTNTIDYILVTKCRHELTSRHETHLVTSYEFLVLWSFDILNKALEKYSNFFCLFFF